MFGRDNYVTPLDVVLGLSNRCEPDQIANFSRLWDQVYASLIEHQASYQYYYDLRHIRPDYYQSGQEVLVYKPRITDKFIFSWMGPYRVHSKVSDLVYHVYNDYDETLHISTVNVKRLCPYHRADHIPHQNTLPGLLGYIIGSQRVCYIHPTTII